MIEGLNPTPKRRWPRLALGLTALIALSGATGWGAAHLAAKTITSPDLEQSLLDLTGITHLVLDFTKITYVSSAGLRVLLALQKTMARQGDMVVRNVDKMVMEVLEMSGFVDILTIE